MTASHKVAEVSGQYLAEAVGQAVPAGYKQTEVGVIPEDWDCKPFGDLFEMNIKRKSIKETDFISFIGMQDVTESAQLSKSSLLKYSEIKSGFTYFENGDVLLAKITPCFENGKGCIAKNLPTEIGFGSTEFHVLRAKEDSDSGFIYFWTTRRNFRLALESEMVGSAGHRRVPLSAIRAYQIPFPNRKSEQTAIANALSDVDALINELEKLIAKKQAIKTATLQQLLTGRTRLPPFALREDGTHKGYKLSELREIPEDWECLNLSEIFSFKQGVQISVDKQIKSERDGYIRFIRIIDLTDPSEPPRFVVDPGRAYHINKDDLFMVRYGVPGLVGYSMKGVVANNLFRLIPRIELKTIFYFHYLGFRHNDILEASGSSTMPAISFSTISTFKIVKPLVEEQTAIATILSDMDADIQTLQLRLSKTRQIKQGMMQELLTGKTRLLPCKPEAG